MRKSHHEITNMRVAIIAQALAVYITETPDGEIYDEQSAPTPERIVSLEGLTGGDYRGVIEFTAKLMSEDVIPMPSSFRRLCLFVALGSGSSYSEVNRMFGIAPSHASRIVNKEGNGREDVAATYAVRTEHAVARLNLNVMSLLDPERAALLTAEEAKSALSEAEIEHENALPVLAPTTPQSVTPEPIPTFSDPEPAAEPDPASPAPGVVPAGPAGAAVDPA